MFVGSISSHHFEPILNSSPGLRLMVTGSLLRGAGLVISVTAPRLVSSAQPRVLFGRVGFGAKLLFRFGETFQMVQVPCEVFKKRRSISDGTGTLWVRRQKIVRVLISASCDILRPHGPHHFPFGNVRLWASPNLVKSDPV